MAGVNQAGVPGIRHRVGAGVPGGAGEGRGEDEGEFEWLGNCIHM